ncbi:class I adenylate-forming enzyme family protein [Tropicibacter sp. Alg240-R139]|uniref:class I adenylate-forming enzyme family protein n=1 Tax=Tropicibacter sp. Alg240-R139 TaxID=2305991 RepID=UPI0013E01F92|nr:class I adenylate-forming enzyme family protein [Tropicibacter sp. Alg240-R139]
MTLTNSPTRITAPQSDDISFLDFGTAFVRHAKERPDHIAVVDETVTLDWRSFDHHARCVAAQLQQEGVGSGTPVAALADNSAAYLTFYAGVILAGGAMVPLPTSATIDVLAKMLDDCGARLRFVSERHVETANGLGFVEAILANDLFDWGQAAPMERPVAVPPESLFDLIYSSGTTGTPKGIIHDHLFRGRQLMRMPVFGLDQDARLLMSTPLYSNTTQVAVLPVLARGGAVISMAKFDTQRFLQLSQDHAITHAMLVPVQYMRLMRDPSFDDFDLSSYSTKLSTSAPLPASLIRDILDRWPGELFELYGMTEGGISSVLDCASFPDKLDTVGRPVQGCDARIIDEQGYELPIGEFGEVVGRAGAMMQGYLNADDKTQEVIWRSPEGEDFIRTGDMGRFDADGFLTLMDRKKDMILSGGFNIYAADLERVLRDHPDVADVAVIAIPSEIWGETPLGLVVPVADGQATAVQIMDWANAQLGKTQRLSRVELRDDLPRSSIGKILKRELRAPYWD